MRLRLGLELVGFAPGQTLVRMKETMEAGSIVPPFTTSLSRLLTASVAEYNKADTTTVADDRGIA